MRKINLLPLAAAALAATLLAGCGGAASSSSSASSGAASTETSSATSSTSGDATSNETSSESNYGASSAASDGAGTGTAAAADANTYSADSLKPVLDKLVSYEVGSAGSSLETAQAAAAIVEYAARVGDTAPAEAVSTDVQAWADALDDKQKEALKANWESVEKTARDIIADPAAQQDLLTTAGVSTDFTTIDVTKAEATLNAINDKLSAM